MWMRQITPGINIPYEHCKDFDLGEAFAKDPKYQEQLLDYIKRGKSNGRKLHLQVMQLPPGMFVSFFVSMQKN